MEFPLLFASLFEEGGVLVVLLKDCRIFSKFRECCVALFGRVPRVKGDSPLLFSLLDSPPDVEEVVDRGEAEEDAMETGESLDGAVSGTDE